MHLDNNCFWISSNKTPCKTNIQRIEYGIEFKLKHELHLDKNVLININKKTL